MTNPVAVLRETTEPTGKRVWVWCPGCEEMHPFTVESDGRLNDGITWDWDGDLEKPTFSPSLLVHYSVHLCEGEHDPVICEDRASCDQEAHRVGYIVDGQALWTLLPEGDEGYERVLGHGQPHTREPAFGNCHSFLREGRWQFLGDCAHSLAGQTVDMVPLPDWWLDARGSQS